MKNKEIIEHYDKLVTEMKAVIEHQSNLLKHPYVLITNPKTNEVESVISLIDGAEAKVIGGKVCLQFTE